MTLKLPIIEAAGGLTIDAKEQILFIFKDGRWDLPKGLIDPKISAPKTAIKEVSEETGLSTSRLSVVSELIPTTHLSKYSKTKSLKQTRWFLLRYSGGNSEFKPQRSEGIEHCEWIPTWELDRILAGAPARIQYLVKFWLKAKKDIDY